jgi:hypothetical protein
MLIRQIKEVQGANELDEGEPNQKGGQQRADDPHEECADEAVAKGLTVSIVRQPEDEDREDDRIVRAEKAFQPDEKQDCDEVGELRGQWRSAQ